MNITANIAHASDVHTDRIRAAQELLKKNTRQGLEALNELFRSGKPPQPALDGPYHGELVATQHLQGLTQLITSFFMPWKGKYLMSADGKGDNIFGKKSRLLFRLGFPFYRGITDYDEESFRAFLFTTSIGKGREDTDIDVFKINYDSPDNPALTIRPILDEVVQVDDGLYLGKIHFKWWWGKWQMVGYFALRTKQPASD